MANGSTYETAAHETAEHFGCSFETAKRWYGNIKKNHSGFLEIWSELSLDDLESIIEYYRTFL